MDFRTIGQKIYSQINQANNILLIAHQQPDADALGSLVVFSDWLTDLGKNHTKFCVDQPKSNLSWLVNFESLADNPSHLLKAEYDLVIVLDSGDLKYAGVAEILADFKTRPFIINIDHHATNQYFGEINLVDPEAVSATEIIYKLFKSLKIKISRSMANALLAGIIYDTYNFTNPNTNQQSLEIASHLLLAGAQLTQVSDLILKTKTIDSLKIWGEILIRLSYNSHFNVVSTVITKRDLAGNLSEAGVAEGVANFLNNLTGVGAALILQEQELGMIKGSFRTNDDLIDVAKLAKILGGGGHRKAAGFKIKGRLVEKDGVWEVV